MVIQRVGLFANNCIQMMHQLAIRYTTIHLMANPNLYRGKFPKYGLYSLHYTFYE